MPEQRKKNLRELVQQVTGHASSRSEQVEIVSLLCRSSQEACRGSVFFAETKAHIYAQEALEKGATAVVVDEPIAGIREEQQILVPDVRLALSRAAHWFYDAPSHELEVFGFTGTNGKTTTTWIANQLLGALGKQTVTIGTLGAF